MSETLTGIGEWFANTWNSVKSIVETVLFGITTAWNTFTTVLNATWISVIQPTINFFVEAFKLAFTVITTMVLTPLYLAWQGMAALMRAIYDTVIKPMIDAFGNAITFLWSNVVSPVIDWIVGKWNFLSTTLSAVWNVIRMVVFEAFKNAMNILWGHINNILNIISNKWNWLKGMLAATWAAIRDAVLEPLKRGLQFLLDKFNQVSDSISNKWNWLKDRLHSVWNFIDNTVFGGIRRGLDIIKNSFKTTADNIGQTWNTIKAKTAKPINFVIDTVYNNGIVKVWDKISDFVGLDKKLPRIPTVAFATGGILPGYTPGKDVHEFISPTAGRLLLSGGEAILRPEVTRAMGKNSVDALNHAAAHGGVTKVKKMLGEGAQFASGGILPFNLPTMRYAKGGDVKIENAIKRTLAFVRGEHGKPYQYGGIGNPSWDCSGLWSGIYQELQAPGTARNGRIFNTESDFGSFGFVPGLSGRVTIGVLSGAGGGAYGHMSGTIDGHNIESASNPKGVQIDGSAWGSDNSYYNHTYTLKDFSGKFVSGGNGGFMSVIRSKIADAIESILNPIGNRIPSFGGWIGEVPKLAFNKLKDTFVGFIEDQTPAGDYAGGVSSNVQDWEPLVRRTLGANGFPVTDRNVDLMLRQIQTESSGNANQRQIVQDINSGGNEGYGLLQVTPTTFAAYRDPNLPNDRGNPEANMTAALRYYRDKYGDDLGVMWGKGHGYKSGGVLDYLKGITTRLYDKGGILKNKTAAVNLSGKPEAIITNDQWKLLRELGYQLSKSFVGRTDKGSSALATLIGDKKVANGVHYMVKQFGDLLGTTEDGKRATEALNKALGEYKDTQKAEKKAVDELAKARKDGDAEKIKTAENALKEARKATKEKTTALVAAEKEVYNTRVKAIGDFIQKFMTSVEAVTHAATKFYQGMGDIQKSIQATCDSIRELELTLANDRINNLSALNSMRMAEIDLAKTRHQGAVNIANAEKALYEARYKATIAGQTGVNALAGAIDRFRETGVFSINQITEEMIVRTQEVRIAEANLQSIKAQNLLDQEAAQLKFIQSQVTYNKVLLEQQKNAALLELQTKKLTEQTAKLHGMNQYEVTGAQRGLEGKQQRTSGILGLLGSIAGGVVSFMTGNIAGGIASIGTGVKSIGDIVTGDKKYKAYQEETKKLEDSLTKDQKAGLIAGNVMSGLALTGGIAAGASGYGGMETINGSLDVAKQIGETTYGTLLEGMNIEMEKIELDFQASQDALMKDYQAKLSQLEMESALQDLLSHMRTTDIEAAKSLASINKSVAEASTKDEANALVQLAKVEEERRQTLIDIQSSAAKDIAEAREIARQQAELAEQNSLNKGNRKIEVKVSMDNIKSSYTAEEVAAILNSINDAQDEFNIRIEELETRETIVGGADYMDAHRR